MDIKREFYQDENNNLYNVIDTINLMNYKKLLDEKEKINEICIELKRQNKQLKSEIEYLKELTKFKYNKNKNKQR